MNTVIIIFIIIFIIKHINLHQNVIKRNHLIYLDEIQQIYQIELSPLYCNGRFSEHHNHIPTTGVPPVPYIVGKFFASGSQIFEDLLSQFR